MVTREGQHTDGPTPQVRRFAFYGRVSTEDNQDPASSRNWQRSRAAALIAPHGGQIVSEYFDVGQSRSLPWQRRPEAKRLLDALHLANRGFADVVVGEPHRAFYGNQFGLTLPLFEHFKVRLWVPEVGGPIDPQNEAHELVMSVFGGMSKGERNRIRLRVRTAMAAQTRMEGRYLGGRPPYGYRLCDLGPHPNPAKAADGKRLHGLELDPVTAPVVERIFEMYLTGHGLLVIAEQLTRDGILCPSAYDRARNRHRSGIAWSKSAIRAILNNPRYTGFQIWNKQRTDEVLVDVNDVALGHTSVMRWNDRDDWVRSDVAAHSAIIGTDSFDQVRATEARRGAKRGGPRKQYRSRHPYVFKGAVYCGVCERKMQAQHSHDVAYYRCRFPQEYALANVIDHPRNVIMREDVMIGPLDTWLATAFDPVGRERTIQALAAASLDDDGPDPIATVARAAIEESDVKLERYRAALEAGADPAIVAGWIRTAQADRVIAERDLRSRTTRVDQALTVEQVTRLVDELGDLATAVGEGTPEDKAAVYQQLGLRLTYYPDKQAAHAHIDLGVRRWEIVGVEGGT